MKKLVILIAIVVAPMHMSAQDAFDSFEFEREVSSVVVTKNMLKLLSQLDLESNDIEAKEYFMSEFRKMVEKYNNTRVAGLRIQSAGCHAIR